MSKTIEALKLAEVWIESLTGLHREVKQEQDDLLFVIREALAEPVQDPVAYCCGFETTHPDGWIDCKIFRDGEFTTPLYAAPVSAEDIRSEALEEAAKVCESTYPTYESDQLPCFDTPAECAAAISGLK